MARQKGHTLWEMLIVLSVMGVMSGLWISGYTTFKRRLEADLAVIQLYQAIITARSEAVRYNSRVTLCSFETKSQSCQTEWVGPLLIFRDDSGEGTLRQKDQMIRLIPYHHSGVVVWKNFRRKNYLSFLPSGFTHYLNGTFLYCPKNREAKYARAIFVDKNGYSHFSTDLDKDGIHEDSDGNPLVC